MKQTIRLVALALCLALVLAGCAAQQVDPAPEEQPEQEEYIADAPALSVSIDHVALGGYETAALIAPAVVGGEMYATYTSMFGVAQEKLVDADFLLIDTAQAEITGFDPGVSSALLQADERYFYCIEATRIENENSVEVTTPYRLTRTDKQTGEAEMLYETEPGVLIVESLALGDGYIGWLEHAEDQGESYEVKTLELETKRITLHAVIAARPADLSKAICIDGGVLYYVDGSGVLVGVDLTIGQSTLEQKIGDGPLQFDCDGDLAVFISPDGALVMRDLASGKEQSVGAAQPIRSAAIYKNRYVVYTTYAELFIYDRETKANGYEAGGGQASQDAADYRYENIVCVDEDHGLAAIGYSSMENNENGVAILRLE